MHQLGHDFLRCDIPTVPLQYTVRADMWTVNTQLYCSNYKGSYMFQLQISHHQAVYVTRVRGNRIPVVCIQLRIMIARYLSLTYKGT